MTTPNDKIKLLSVADRLKKAKEVRRQQSSLEEKIMQLCEKYPRKRNST